MRPRSLGACLALALSLAVPLVARAHLTQSAQTTTRFVEVCAHAGRLELVYGIAVGERPANDARRRMDLDHDGLVSADEQAEWRERLGARLGEELVARLDGVPVALRFQGKMLMSDNRLGDIAFFVEYTASVPLAAGEHGLELDDRLELASSGEHELGFKDGPGGRFLSSARGGAAPVPERQARFDGPRKSDMEERRVTFRFVVDAAPPRLAGAVAAPVAGGLGPLRIFLFVLVVSAALAGAFLLAKRVRRG